MKAIFYCLCSSFILLPWLRAGESPSVPDISLQDLDGVTHELAHSQPHKPQVYVVVGTECPISNAMIPYVGRLHTGFGERVDLFLVVSDRLQSLTDAQEHFAGFEIEVPVLFDASGMLAERLRPTHLPEAFVFGEDNRLVYRGALNNSFNDLGRRRANVENHYLRQGIEAALARTPAEPAYVEPVGCFFESSSILETGGEITYHRDIAPIIQARCLSCHRAGQAAPFGLMDYESVAKRGRQIMRVTHDKIMPPWMARPGAQPKFVEERWLRPHEQALLDQWIEGGRAEGDPADSPPLPTFPSGWELGEPDLVLRMREPFEVYADGPDILQNFVIPIDVPEDKLVRAIQFRPGNKRVVHHSVLFLDDKAAAQALDAATPEPGYSNFGGAGFLPSGALGGWSVGNTARELPDGMGRYLKKGSDLVMQIHYHPTGKKEVDQSEVGIYFIDRPVEEVLSEPARLISSFWISDYELEIPAGDESFESSASYILPRDIVLVGVVPHMHLLGKSMKVTATLPDQTRKTLIDIPIWNYNWQDEFYYDRPFTLPAGTELEVSAQFDNSRNNPSNPSDPPKPVSWGDGTLDEMMFCFFLFSAQETEDIIHTALDNLAHDLRQPRLQPADRPE